jgi:hypothetical protein
VDARTYGSIWRRADSSEGLGASILNRLLCAAWAAGALAVDDRYGHGIPQRLFACAACPRRLALTRSPM